MEESCKVSVVAAVLELLRIALANVAAEEHGEYHAQKFDSPYYDTQSDHYIKMRPQLGVESV